MRSKKEIFDLILSIAKKDARVRAVVLNGSRANPNISPDIFQDFDIAFLVDNLKSIVEDKNWHKQFGEILIMQTPETMNDPAPDNNGKFTYLLLFTDGNRIDLNLIPIEQVSTLAHDSLAVPLLDKDHILPKLPEANESSYYPQAPTAKNYADCTNEFWWVATYVAKGLWRQELTYAKAMQEIIRKQMMKMLTWYLGIKTDFKKNLGKEGKYFKDYLEDDLWQKLTSTYANFELEDNWQSLTAMLELMQIISKKVALDFGFEYPESEDKNVSNYIKHIRSLPQDAKSIFPED